MFDVSGRTPHAYTVAYPAALAPVIVRFNITASASEEHPPAPRPGRDGRPTGHGAAAGELTVVGDEAGPRVANLAGGRSRTPTSRQESRSASCAPPSVVARGVDRCHQEAVRPDGERGVVHRARARDQLATVQRTEDDDGTLAGEGELGVGGQSVERRCGQQREQRLGGVDRPLRDRRGPGLVGHGIHGEQMVTVGEAGVRHRARAQCGNRTVERAGELGADLVGFEDEVADVELVITSGCVMIEAIAGSDGSSPPPPPPPPPPSWVAARARMNSPTSGPLSTVSVASSSSIRISYTPVGVLRQLDVPGDQFIVGTGSGSTNGHVPTRLPASSVKVISTASDHALTCVFTRKSSGASTVMRSEDPASGS